MVDVQTREKEATLATLISASWRDTPNECNSFVNFWNVHNKMAATREIILYFRYDSSN
jgi:hypothetical protein